MPPPVAACCSRAKIEEKLDAGWKFDTKRWAESIARHGRWDLSKVFKQFDVRACPPAALSVVTTLTALLSRFACFTRGRASGMRMNVLH